MTEARWFERVGIIISVSRRHVVIQTRIGEIMVLVSFDQRMYVVLSQPRVGLRNWEALFALRNAGSRRRDWFDRFIGHVLVDEGNALMSEMRLWFIDTFAFLKWGDISDIDQFGAADREYGNSNGNGRMAGQGS